VKLREQRGLDARGGLVAGPQSVAKRLDHVIGRHTDVRCSVLDHLEHRPKHANDGAERTILALVEAAQPVEVAEQLVRAVDGVNDHAVIMP
jgi:hypothetical protein